MRGAHLNGANLRGTDLHGANLKKARLRQADLRGADLTEADLSGADLRKAKLKEARLDQAVLKDTRGLSGGISRAVDSVKARTHELSRPARSGSKSQSPPCRTPLRAARIKGSPSQHHSPGKTAAGTI